MRLIILLALLAIALPFVISMTATPLGYAVSERFLERPTADDPPYTVPPPAAKGPALTVDALKAWARDHAVSATGYATRVIPLDMLYLFLLGAFLGLASTTLAGLIRWPTALPALPTFIWWLLPGLYIVCDLAEDSMIFAMLHWPTNIESLFDTLANARAVKIWSVKYAMVQVLLLDILSFVFVPPKV